MATTTGSTNRAKGPAGLSAALLPALCATWLASSCASAGPTSQVSGTGARALEASEVAAERGTAAGLDDSIQRRVLCMGTWLDLEVRARDRTTALGASEACILALEAVEARLSTWTASSELALLNRSPVGETTVLSAELARDLERAASLRDATRGAFDPAIGSLVEAWGLRAGGRRPTADELALARSCAGMQFIELGDRWARRTHAGVRFEEGGFGKGVGLERGARAAIEHGAGAVRLDLGGQVLVALADAAQRSDGSHWIALAHPDARHRPVLEIELASGSLATSGNSERGIEVDGRRLSHLIDPRSGAPVPDFGSLSVWCADPFVADALSTALYVTGPERAFALAESLAPTLGPIRVLVIERSEHGLRATAGPGWRADQLRVAAPELELHFLGSP